MKIWITTGIVLLLLVVLAIQLVPYGRNHANPPVLAEPQWNSPATRTTFMQACGDCHSNETVWPWYTQVAPVSWLVQRDVDEGRASFNVSEWGRRENESDDAAEVVQEGEMPPVQYTLMHPAAKLSGSARQAFTDGLVATFGGENDREREDKD